jgi:hypothetical protein
MARRRRANNQVPWRFGLGVMSALGSGVAECIARGIVSFIAFRPESRQSPSGVPALSRMSGIRVPCPEVDRQESTRMSRSRCPRRMTAKGQEEPFPRES